MNPIFSRRKMLFAGGATLLASATVVGNMKAQGDPTYHLNASDRELFTLPGSDSRFSQAVGDLYPHLQDDPVFQELSPLALLITHKRGPGVRAFSTAWRVTNKSGTFETAMFSYTSPGSAAKGRSPNLLRSARRIIIPKTQSTLITPFFNWPPDYFRANPQPDWKKILTPTEPGKFLVSEMQTATKVEVLLDGVVFADWKIMGPDKHNLTRRLRSRRNAEHDEGLAVHKLFKSGASDQEIVQALQKHLSAPRSNKVGDPERWYEQARRFQANFLLRAFHDTDREAFIKAIKHLRNQKRTVITRLDT
jgi:hypothetical protein